MKAILSILIRKHKFISIIVAIIIILTGWWMIANIMPHPLGDKLVYLGKQDYGSPFGDSRPAATYYYGTDMSANEIKGYFKGAKYTENNGQIVGDSSAETLYFSSSEGNFTVDYYSDNTLNHSTIKQRYLISVESYDYGVAEASLR